jgi:hypothetical protein
MSRRRPIVLLGLVSLALCSGCTKYYHVEIGGVVRSAGDGKPLAGVQVYYSRYDDIDVVALGNTPDATTDANGQFSIAEKEAGSLPATMRLILVKEGFEKETIDIRPQKEPASYDSPVVVAVVAQLGRSTVAGGR